MRLLMDVDDWDAGLFVGLAGQSGDPELQNFVDMATG